MASIPYVISSEPGSAVAKQTPTSRRNAIALRSFFRIADAWKLTNDDAIVLLGRPGRATFYKWKRGDVRTVPHDTIRRISYLLGIWKTLQILFRSTSQADGWVHRANELFGGRSPLERMLGGDVVDLAVVRGLLDHVRGGGA